MFIKSVMPSNHLILCRPLLLLSIFASIKVFSNESVLHIRWPKYWRFSFSISPSNEYSGLISFRVNPKRFSLISLQSKGVSSVFSNSTWYLLFQTCPTPALGSAWGHKGTQASGGANTSSGLYHLVQWWKHTGLGGTQGWWGRSQVPLDSDEMLIKMFSPKGGVERSISVNYYSLITGTMY